MKHEVITLNAYGETLYSEKFDTVDKAYNEYTDIIRILSATLPKGHEVTVVRSNEGLIMTMKTIHGTK